MTLDCSNLFGKNYFGSITRDCTSTGWEPEPTKNQCSNIFNGRNRPPSSNQNTTHNVQQFPTSYRR
jgi:hypothetical protein